MESFFNSWRWVEEGLRDGVSDEIKASLLWNQIKDYTTMQAELIPYRLSSPGEQCHSYGYLVGAIGKHTERTRQERCREQIVSGIQTLG
eukprot:4321598-Amphidinium_carterae.1